MEWRNAANWAIGWEAYNGEPASGLLALQGVGYPMASAILDILDPDVWPVIDKWAVQTVFGKDAKPKDLEARQRVCGIYASPGDQGSGVLGIWPINPPT